MTENIWKEIEENFKEIKRLSNEISSNLTELEETRHKFHENHKKRMEIVNNVMSGKDERNLNEILEDINNIKF